MREKLFAEVKFDAFEADDFGASCAWCGAIFARSHCEEESNNQQLGDVFVGGGGRKLMQFFQHVGVDGLLRGFSWVCVDVAPHLAL